MPCFSQLLSTLSNRVFFSLRPTSLEPNPTRQDVSRVSLTKRKGPGLVMFKSAVFALSDSSLPSPPCSLYQNGYIRSTLAFCLQLKVDQWEVLPRRQEREELGVLIS